MKLENIDKVYSEVNFFQAFTSLNIFDPGNVIESHVKILQLFEFVQVL